MDEQLQKRLDRLSGPPADVKNRRQWWIARMAQAVADVNPEVKEIRWYLPAAHEKDETVVPLLVVLSHSDLAMTQRQERYNPNGMGFHLAEFIVLVLAITTEEIEEELERGNDRLRAALASSRLLYSRAA